MYQRICLNLSFVCHYNRVVIHIVSEVQESDKLEMLEKYVKVRSIIYTLSKFYLYHREFKIHHN